MTERPDDRALWAVAKPVTGCSVDQPCAECVEEGATPRYMWAGVARTTLAPDNPTSVTYLAACPACGKDVPWAGSPAGPVEIRCECQAVEVAA